MIFSIWTIFHNGNRGSGKMRWNQHGLYSEFGIIRHENHSKNCFQWSKTSFNFACGELIVSFSSIERSRAYGELSVQKWILYWFCFAHFQMDFYWIFHQIRRNIMIFWWTSTDHNSSLRWSWVMFKHTGTMCSSRYVDSQHLNCSITNLGAPNCARKLTEFWQNHRFGLCTTLPRFL